MNPASPDPGVEFQNALSEIHDMRPKVYLAVVKNRVEDKQLAFGFCEAMSKEKEEDLLLICSDGKIRSIKEEENNLYWSDPKVETQDASKTGRPEVRIFVPFTSANPQPYPLNGIPQTQRRSEPASQRRPSAPHNYYFSGTNPHP